MAELTQDLLRSFWGGQVELTTSSGGLYRCEVVNATVSPHLLIVNMSRTFRLVNNNWHTVAFPDNQYSILKTNCIIKREPEECHLIWHTQGIQLTFLTPNHPQFLRL